MLRFVNTHEFIYFHENQKFAITGELHRGGEAGLSTLMRGRHLCGLFVLQPSGEQQDLSGGE